LILEGSEKNPRIFSHLLLGLLPVTNPNPKLNPIRHCDSNINHNPVISSSFTMGSMRAPGLQE